MEKLINFYLLIFGFLLISCQDDLLPPDLYGYQIEQLLSGQEGKAWVVQNETSPYGNGLWITPDGDSVAMAGYNGTDTIFRMKADASSFRLVFTDSIIFSSGEIWFMKDVIVDRFEFKNSDGASYLYTTVD